MSRRKGRSHLETQKLRAREEFRRRQALEVLAGRDGGRRAMLVTALARYQRLAMDVRSDGLKPTGRIRLGYACGPAATVYLLGSHEVDEWNLVRKLEGQNLEYIAEGFDTQNTVLMLRVLARIRTATERLQWILSKGWRGAGA
jgi:hypothetical protein